MPFAHNIDTHRQIFNCISTSIVYFLGNPVHILDKASVGAASATESGLHTTWTTGTVQKTKTGGEKVFSSLARHSASFLHASCKKEKIRRSASQSKECRRIFLSGPGEGAIPSAGHDTGSLFYCGCLSPQTRAAYRQRDFA